MKKKSIILLFAILLTGGIAAAQRTHTGHYFYKGQRVEVPVCDEVVLVYFRTGVMPADEVRQHYRCLREVRLDGRKGDNPYGHVVHSYTVHGENVSIDFRNLPKGYYTMSITDKEGHTLATKTIVVK